jgi:hypothetical protein
MTDGATEDGQVLIIDLPEDLAAEAVEDLGARWDLSVRGAGQDAQMVLGLGGSLISLIQTPTSVHDFIVWLLGVLQRRRTTTVLKFTQSSDGSKTINLSPDINPDAVIEIMKHALGVTTDKRMGER